MTENQMFDADLLALLAEDARSQAVAQDSTASTDSDGSYPASFAQEQLWFVGAYAPEDVSYNVNRALFIEVAPDHAVLQQAFRRLVQRHAIFRTRFFMGDSGLRQFIIEDVGFHLEQVQLPQSGADFRTAVEARMAHEASQPFDLAAPPLLRATLFVEAAGAAILLISMHHMASDARSSEILAHELSEVYAALAADADAAIDLPAPHFSYKDFAVQQRAAMAAGQFEGDLQYWRTYLAAGVESVEFSALADATGRAPVTAAPGCLRFELEADSATAIAAFCSAAGVTPFVALLAIWQLFLARYAGRQGFLVGVPNSGRYHAEVNDVVGYFVNTQMYRVALNEQDSFRAFCRRLQGESIAALDHASAPLELLVKELGLSGAAGSGALFNAMFHFQQEREAIDLRLGAARCTVLAVDAGDAKFDLNLGVIARNGVLECALEYGAALSAPATVALMGAEFRRLASLLLSDSDSALGNLPLTSAQEFSLLQAWGQGGAGDSASALPTLQQLFDQQALEAPASIALVCGEQQLSYGELAVGSNRLAHWLRSQGVGPEVKVGLSTPRSLSLAIGVLAILKAGGAYVPLDPQHPAQRLAYMARSSGMQLLLIQGEVSAELLAELAEVDGLQVVSLESLQLDDQPQTTPQLELSADNLAYVLYTSGSTGTPKGVAMRHGVLSQLLQWQQASLPRAQRSLQFASFGFDVSFQEMLSTWTEGATLVMATESQRHDFSQLLTLIAEQEVERIYLPFAVLQALAEVATLGPTTPALRQIITAGEQLKMTPALSNWLARLPQCRLYNQYGPTETHVVSQHQAQEGALLPPIGKATRGAQLYVLNASLQLTPPGVAGELYLGGSVLARGYLNRPGLTAERFIADPFGRGQRLYRTGDLARWNADGELEYLGRIDHQVKVRGFRIELGEVESQLLALDGVQEAVVIADAGPAGTRLVGYVTPQTGVTLDLTQLRQRLAARVPEYMVPAALMVLPALPLNANGKVERKALPAPVFATLAYVAPLGAQEQLLAGIWSELLGVEQVGRHDNFFELGGDSILSLQVVARAQQAGIHITPRQLFEHQQIAELVALLETADGRQEAAAGPAIAALSGSRAALPLSHAQQRQWFLWHLQPDGGAYHIAGGLRLTGRLSVDAVRASLDALLARHESLRTLFRMDVGGAVTQTIQAQGAYDWQYQDLRPAADAEARVAELSSMLARRPFDLAQGPLLRVGVYQLQDEECILAVAMHHIVSDGWSMRILLEEFVQSYQAQVRGLSYEPPALAIQYADYAVWQREWLAAGEQERQLAYWKNYLGNEHPVLALPTLQARQPLLNYHAASIALELPAGLAASLKKLARQHGATPFMVLLASLQMVLQRYSGQTDIRIGIANANRNRVETEGLIGFFINTQVLRAQIDDRATLAAVLAQAKASVAGAQSHQDLPFDVLVEALQPERSLGHSPLFQVMHNHLREDYRALQQLDGLTAETYGAGAGMAQFDLVLNTQESSAGDLSGNLVYAAGLYAAPLMQQLAQHYVATLQALVQDAGQALGDVDLLPPQEREHLLAWGRNQQVQPQAAVVHALIEQQVTRAPAATALMSGEDSLSYAELNRRANRLAHRLIALGVAPEVRVGLALERSPEMLVGLLAVLKAGGVYVPLDPDYPAERLAYMMADSGIRLLLTQSQVRPRLPAPAAQDVAIIELDTLDLHSESSSNPDVAMHADNLAYVIYTSGSTGKPKGVGVAHGPLSRHCQAITQRYAMTAQDRELQFASINFDIAHERWISSLLSGSAIVLCDIARRSINQVIDDIRRYRVTLMFMTPSYLQQLTAVLQQQATALDLRLCIVGGEAWSAESVASASGLISAHGLVNAYGPTETVIAPTAWNVHQPVQGNYAPIGKVVGARQAYVLDGAMQLAPAGMPGELYLGGLLARGYLDRPGLTAERFVPDPFGSGQRLYRSGDLVRWNAAGDLEYLGRIDQQVKLRGFRIELGEVEAQLLALDGVREAVVVADAGPAGTRLVGYATAQPGRQLDLAHLRAGLSATLPDYMVPGALMILDALPLTANGKIDRKALPSAGYQAQGYVAPQGQIETTLAAVWSAVLGVAQVGRYDNFFELGGDSILSLQLVARAQQAGILITPRQLFEHQQIAALAAVLDSADGRREAASAPAIPLVTGSRAALPLSHAQQRQWFLWRLQPDSSAYHITGGLRLTGSVQVAAVRASLDALVARHASLRTIFPADAAGNVTQQLAADGSYLWQYQDLRSHSDAQAHAAGLAAELSRRVFDLERGPLLRVGVYQLHEDECILAVAMHHIVSDGWSMRILLEEFVQGYQAQVRGLSYQAPALAIQYADYAVWQREWLAAGEQERQLAYWKNYLGDEHPVLALPTQQVREPLASYPAASIAIDLPAGLGAGIRTLAQQQGATPFMVLLAALQLVLHRHSGQQDIRIGIANANRNRVETERLIGFFVNTQVLRAQIDGRASLVSVLAQAKASVAGAQAHQDLPFDVLVEALQPERSLAHTPLFQVMHNHQRKDYRVLEQLDGLEVEGYGTGVASAQFDLELNTEEGPDGSLAASLVYADGLYATALMARLAQDYAEVLQALTTDAAQTVEAVDLLGEAGRSQLFALGRNRTLPAASSLVHERIAGQARRAPTATALVCEGESLSYGELEAQANRLARHLQSLGVGPEVKVGIAAGRSLHMMVGLLAILKAGGAYVPLDPNYPAERLSYMMADSGIRLLLTDSRHVSRFADMGEVDLHLIALDALDVDGLSREAPVVSVQSGNLAYVIYTSGSTGKPKGVFLSHAALAGHAEVSIGFFGLSAADRSLQFSTMNFDGFVEQVFPPLCVGATLIVRGDELWDSQTLYRTIIDERISVADLTTAYWQMLCHDFAARGPVDFGVLRQLHAGGEAMSVEAVRQWQALGGGHIRLLNTYGPTEAAVTATTHVCTMADVEAGYVPIGAPLAGRDLYVLDAGFNLALPGCAGELCIGGELLARGYLNRPGLTAERFVADPFGGQGGRLYRTGDLARWNADGELEYLGRIDHQVKVRGFRIELGEVESQLLALDDVREAVVIADAGPSGTRLIAYVTAQTGVTLESAQVRAGLAARLPDYMVPSALMILPTLPLNANGKIDRKALPAPTFAVAGYLAPEGEVEQTLATIWSELLGVEQVGRHDNFFELGGDSILSLQIVARLRTAGWKITPRQLFERQTVALLASVAIRAEAQVHVAASGAVPLLPIQHDFFDAAMPQRAHWNQSVLLQGRGVLDVAALEGALNAVLQAHDALRLRFTQDEAGQWQQAYGPVAALSEVLWRRQIGDASEIETHCDAAQRSLSITDGPLLRALLIELADGGWRLLLAVHHLVVDGVSWRILLGDLQHNYASLQAGEPLPEAQRSSSYQDWSLRLQAYGQSQAVQQEAALWQTIMQTPVGLAPQTALAAGKQGEVKDLSLQLDETQTRRLLQEAPAAYRTQVNDLLLTALGRALSTLSGTAQVRIDLEGHGREDLFDDIDLSRTVGWFTSLFPVALNAQGELGQAIKRVKEDLRAIPARGLAYGLLRRQHDTLRSAAPSAVVFNYLGQFDASFDGSAPWQIAGEASGAQLDEQAPLEHGVSINGAVYDGELRLSISYDSQRYTQATMEAFIKTYQHELEAVIAHCSSGVRGVTPSDFPLAGLSQAQLDALPLDLTQVEDLYGLSPMQEGMLFHTLYGGSGHAYVNQLRLDLQGLDEERFRQAWEAAAARHAILRTGFVQQDGQLVQWVHRAPTLPFVVETVEAEQIDELATGLLEQGFELQRAPLQQLTLVRTGPGRHHFIWTSHHVLLDGWSTAQLMAEVLRHYRGEALPQQGGRYRDYIAWLQQQDHAASETYWRGVLAEVDTPTLVGKHNSELQQHGHGDYAVQLDTAQTARLSACARRERVTLNTLIQAAWALVLQRRTGQRVVSFGATVAGRPGDLPGAQELLGLFINTLPVVAKIDGAMPLGDWLRQLQAQSLASREHEQVPLYEVQRWANVAGRSLFDSILVFENYPVDKVLAAPSPDGLQIGRLQTREETNYPLTLAVVGDDSLTIQFNYDLDYLSQQTVQAMAADMLVFLQHLSGPELHVPDQLGGLFAEQNRQLLSWGEGSDRLTETRPVHVLIEAQARQTADAIALVSGEVALSYGELNTRANALAHRLIAAGVTPEVRVGLALERSPEMVIGLLAILKAGGAYVPLDADYPAERLAHMMEDSGIGVLLTQSQLLARLPAAPADVVVLALDALDLADASLANPAVALHADNLAYVIYTSGSTGQPKGVAVAHGALSQHCAAIGRRYAMTPQDRLLQFSSISFDAAGEQWLAPLLAGAAIVLRGAAVWTTPQLLQEIERHAISMLYLPPAYIDAFARDIVPGSVRLSACIVGGEAWSRSGFETVQRNLQPQRIFNAYGPAETIITPTLWQADGATSFATPYAPIGRPLGARNAYILDAGLQLTLPGVVGELYLGGLMARAYLNRAGLTAERFVPDPFGGNGGRLYRSGDLARWNADGELEYIGRIDHQVKVRGFRIELGEVEAQLLALDGVREAVVVADSGPSGTRLAAYVSAQDGVELEVDKLRAGLAAKLPDYMLPGLLMVLASLPLNANGKIDRKALPAGPQQQDYAAPQGPREQALAAVWSALLAVERVGRHDNFFELGGDSILSLQVAARAQQAGISLTPKQLFEHPDIASLVAALDTNAGRAEATGGPIIPVVPGSRDNLPLSHAQQRLWFLWHLQPDSSAYHIVGGLRLKGGLQADAVRASFDALLARHESLRTNFTTDAAGNVTQMIHAQGAYTWQQEDVRLHADAEARAAELSGALARQVFDLAQGPLLRVGLYQVSEQEQILAVAMHHIVSDGWSMRILLEEFVQGYQAQVQGSAQEAAALPIQYADYAVWQRQWLADGAQQHQLAYWKNYLGDEHPVLTLPTQQLREPLASYAAATQVIDMPAGLGESVKQLARQHGATPFMVLLSALQVVLHRHSGQKDIRIGIANANRNRVETEPLIGFFINTQVLRAQLEGATSLAAVLQQAKAGVAGAQAHQDLPFDVLVEALQPQRSLGQSALFQVMHNHQRADYRVLEQLQGLSVEAYATGPGTAQFDLELNTWETADGMLSGSLVYADGVYSASMMARMAQHYVEVLQALTQDAGQAVGAVNLLDRHERAGLLAWGSNPGQHGPAQAIHALIEAQVQRAPAATALAFGDQQLSYAELNARANRLAHRLLALGVGPEVRVGLALERSLEMVVGLLAVLKAGGAYVPLDPDYPQERLAYMIEDSRISLLLTQRQVRERLPQPDAQALRILELDSLDLSGESAQDPLVAVHAENLAYVIYTSGSTGKPKGAANRHIALHNRLAWMQQAYQLTADDVVLQKTPFSFDVSVWEFFWPLMVGATLAIARPQDHRDPQRLSALIAQHRVSTLHFVPSMLQAFVSHADLHSCGSLTRILCSGEALPADLQDRTMLALPGATLHNLYGPTEAAIDVTHWDCIAGTPTVPIGRPISGIQTHVVDSGFNLAPQGAIGELMLGGVGLARGYLNRPGLTAERFVPSEFGRPGERLYRTGDLAKWRDDGALEYLGRIDHQVKIRGLRIELGEIESQLLMLDEVHEAVVVAATHDGSSHLVAYLTANHGQTLDLSSVRQRLALTLPDYMVPALLMVLEALPLNANGKIDRKALPAPAFGAQEYSAPSGAMEQSLARVWESVLEIERVGRHDNFFELGGHSLSAMQVQRRVRQELGVDFKLALLFSTGSLSGLAQALEAETKMEKSNEDQLLEEMNALLGMSE